jgi:biopolymer transport protein ExbB/TolQ
MYISRLKFQKNLNNTLSRLKSKELKSLKEFHELKGNSLFTSSLKNILNYKNRLYAEKEIMDFELACEKDLAQSKTITRLGPMLGLMGTLIPMGPALVGLAAGDIASMAQNMQVAFSTTVVGLFAGALGYVLQLIKQRWYVEDLNNLEFIFNVRYNDDKCKASVQLSKEEIYN